MVTNDETTVKVSRWLLSEIDKYVNSSRRNKSNFPSKRNLVDRALIDFLEKNGVKLEGGKNND